MGRVVVPPDQDRISGLRQLMLVTLAGSHCDVMDGLVAWMRETGVEPGCPSSLRARTLRHSHRAWQLSARTQLIDERNHEWGRLRFSGHARGAPCMGSVDYDGQRQSY